MISCPYIKTMIGAGLCLAMVTAASATRAGPVVEQICVSEASRMKNVPASEVRIVGKVAWADGSSVVRLEVKGKLSACWLNPGDEARAMVFAQGVAPGMEQVCAGEASLIKDVRMSAVRLGWAFEGPGGQAWVHLNVDGQPADCHVNKDREVVEVRFARYP